MLEAAEVEAKAAVEADIAKFQERAKTSLKSVEAKVQRTLAEREMTALERELEDTRIMEKDLSRMDWVVVSGCDVGL